MESETYEYNKLGPLPPHLCYACRKGDIDRCLEQLQTEPPFHRVWMSKWVIREDERDRRLKGRVLRVASASSRFIPHPNPVYDPGPIVRDLSVEAVPKEIAHPVRIQLQTNGLHLLIDWLRRAVTQPQVWLWHDHAAHLLYFAEEDRVSLLDMDKP